MKTVWIPDEYHAWLTTHKREGETMGEALRRLTHAPPPSEPHLTETEANGMHKVITHRREADHEHLSQVTERLDAADIE